MGIKMMAMTKTSAPIADLINKLDAAMAERYGENGYKMMIGTSDYPISLRTSDIGFIPPTVEETRPVIMITRHYRDEKLGWQPLTRSPADSTIWDKRDQSWIRTLLECGDTTLQVGDTMYEVSTVEVAG